MYRAIYRIQGQTSKCQAVLLQSLCCTMYLTRLIVTFTLNDKFSKILACIRLHLELKKKKISCADWQCLDFRLSVLVLMLDLAVSCSA